SRRHSCSLLTVPSCFFFPVPPPAALHSLSLHDALPICLAVGAGDVDRPVGALRGAEQIDQLRDPVDRRGDLVFRGAGDDLLIDRSEEHTSELQSRFDLVCRLLLEKKKKKNRRYRDII